MRDGEPSCDACRAEARKYWRRHHSSYRRPPTRIDGHNPGWTPLQILSIVEANQPVTTRELAAFINVSTVTIARAMYRLIRTNELVKTGAVLTLPN